MYDPDQLRLLIVRPTLLVLGLHSAEAEELMLGTCAHESKGGTYLKQIGGIALGAWQMEPATHNDIWKCYLPNQTFIVNKLIDYCKLRDSLGRDALTGLSRPDPDMMIHHLRYACAMARIHYHRKPEPIPKDLDAQAVFWKLYYNTPKGKGTPEQYISDYNLFIGAKKKVKGA